jgi:acyl-coenzyme A thioesterase PaaI-like protein
MLRLFRALLVAAGTTATLIAAVAWQPGAPPKEQAPGPLPVLTAAGPRWYKGNLHTHSLWSDGDDFPEMIADWYKRKGYHFLGLSDHNILAEGQRWVDVEKRDLALKKYRARFGAHWVEERESKGKKQVRLKPLDEYRSTLEEAGKFLLIPAEEVTHRFGKNPVHINAINLRDVIKPIDGKDITETIRVNERQISGQGKKLNRRMLAFLNHPNFGWGVRAEDMAGAGELRFFEVYNGHPSVRNEGDAVHPDCDRMWDIALALRLAKYGFGNLYGVATDDAHRYHAWGVGKVNPGRGWVMVRAPYLSAEAIVKAMEDGDFYCSTGVALEEIKQSPAELRIKVKAEPGVQYRVDFIATLRETSLESEARLDRDGKPLAVTRVYHKDVGKVVATSAGPLAVYKPSGKELYVRARVTSDKAHPNPYKKGDVEMAWTQPVVVKKR